MRRHLVRVGVSLVAAALGSGWVAPAAERPTAKIAPWVKVAGVHVGGFTSEQARRRVELAYARPLRFTFEGEHWAVSPERLGAGAAVNEAIAEALRARAGEPVDLTVEAQAPAVRRYVAELDRRYSRPARDARLLGLVNLRPNFSDAQPGRAVRRQAMEAAILRRLRSTVRRPLPVVMRAIEPKLTRVTFGPVVVIRRESKRLDLFDGARPVRSFGVATGQAEYPTPLGSYEVVDKQRHPWWRPPDSDWAKDAEPIPPGPGNPLGTRWMGISAPAVGIHGTPDAASIGYSASHGCVRMRVPEAEWLFERVKLGTPVIIVSA